MFSNYTENVRADFKPFLLFSLQDLFLLDFFLLVDFFFSVVDSCLQSLTTVLLVLGVVGCDWVEISPLFLSKFFSKKVKNCAKIKKISKIAKN